MSISLRGSRVLLRPWQDSDLAPFAALNADPEVMRHFPSVLTLKQTEELIQRIRGGFDQRGWGLWALEVDGQFIGFTGLSVPAFDAHFTPCVEVGWRLARAAWGQGYASEAARLAVGYGFEQLGLAEIVSFTAVANQRSRAVMERLGMTNDAADDFDHPRIEAGHPIQRHVLYRLPRAAWQASAP